MAVILWQVVKIYDEYDGYLVKANSEGVEQQIQINEGAGRQTSDRGYILDGGSDTNVGERKALLIKTDESGIEVWT